MMIGKSEAKVFNQRNRAILKIGYDSDWQVASNNFLQFLA